MTCAGEFIGYIMFHTTGQHEQPPHPPPQPSDPFLTTQQEMTECVLWEKHSPAINTSALHYMSNGFIKPSITYWRKLRSRSAQRSLQQLGLSSSRKKLASELILLLWGAMRAGFTASWGVMTKINLSRVHQRRRIDTEEWKLKDKQELRWLCLGFYQRWLCMVLTLWY